ncbi:hypothetical protein SPB21_07435 [Leptothoe sp. ISB3NOV94-8A]
MVASEARSRRLRILIGSDQQDWSAHWSVLSIGRSGLSDERDPGKIPVTGTLEIKGNTINPPESIDPAINPVRWNPGVNIYIQARNDANTAWIDTWFSRLKILKTPKRPRTNGNLVLEVGCKIQWGNQSQFEDDRSGIIYGQAEPCNAVATRLIQASGIDGGVSLSTWPYSMDRPVGKRQNSFLEQAADLAYANDWHYLYQDINGSIVDREFTLASGSPIATVTVGQDDIIYEPADGEERPAETTKVAGTGFLLGSIENPSVDIEDVLVNFNDISPNSVGDGIGERVITTTSFTSGATPTKTKRVQVFRAEALVFQDPDIPSQLIEVSDTNEFETYETGKVDPTTARLTQFIKTELVKGRTLDPTDEVFNMRQTYRKQEDMTYGAGEPMTRYQCLEKQAAIVLDDNALGPWAEVTTEDLDYEWTEYATGKFDRVDKDKQPLISLRSNINREFANPEALLTRVRKFNRNTPNKPFETVFFDAGIDEDSTEFEGSAAYIAPGGPSGVEKERLFTVADGFGFSEEQMEALAIKHRDLIIGRERSYEIGLAITDALLQAPPLAQINVVDVDGSTYEYLSDSLSFEFQEARSEAFCFGIWIDGGYQKAINIAATIPAGRLNTEIIQSSFSIATSIPAGRLTINLTTGFSVAVTIPGGQLNTTIVSSFSVSATIPAGQLNTQIQAPILIAASIPAGQLSTTIIQSSFSIAAAIPAGRLNTAVVPSFSVSATIPQGQLTSDIASNSADPDAAVYIAALSGSYSQAQQNAINQFFVDLKANATWDELDEIVIFRMQAEADALISLKTATSVIINNGATFTAGIGFTTGSGGYLDSGFNPALATKYQRDSATIAYEVNGTNSGLIQCDVGGRASTSTSPEVFIATKTSASRNYRRLNSTSGGSTFGAADAGVFAVQRTSPILTTVYKEGVSIGSESIPSTAVPDVELYVGAYSNNESATRIRSADYAFVAFGSGSVNIATLTNAWATLKSVL